MKQLLFTGLAFFLLFSTVSCGDDGGSVPQTRLELIQNRWKVAEGLINGFPVPLTPDGFGAIRAEFGPTNYTYRFPAYGAEAAEYGVPTGTPVTQNGTWEFAENETKILLRASGNTGAPFEWRIVELTFSNLQAEYQALNPLTGQQATYLIKYTFSAD